MAGAHGPDAVAPGVLETGARAVALDDAVKDDAGAPAGSWRQLSMGPVYCTELTLEDVVEMNRAAHR